MLIRPISALLLLVLTCALAVPGAALGGTSSEYRVKAAFLLNFLKFIEWPKDVFADSEEKIVVAIVGDDPFGALLEEAFAGKTVRGRSVSIIRHKNLPVSTEADVVFVGPSEDRRLREILGSLEGVAILTIGESERFGDAGGMIRLFVENRKVLFEVNPDEAARSDLKISSKLLGIARIRGRSGERGS